MRRSTRYGADLLSAAFALGGWLLAASGPAVAQTGPTTLRIRVANDLDAAALAQIRERVQSDARLCRGLLHLPDAAPPELPDAQLRKIVYFDDERLFRPDRLGNFSTARSVQVDEASRCEPFVWVTREAAVTIGCESHVVGIGRLALETWLPGIPRPAPKPPEVKALPVAASLCPARTKAIPSDGASPVDAGFGRQCVWMSGLVRVGMGAAAGPTPDPRPRHGDACLLAGRTGYRSPQLPARPIELMSHWTRPQEGPPDSGAVQYLAGNTHLAQYEEGGAIADSELSNERVKAFIEMPWREPLP
jgi:hypothetical protein